MIYIIGSCYLNNHIEECIVVKNKTLMIEEMTNIVGALGNLYVLCRDADLCLPAEVLNILCEKLECKERKHKYRGELEFVERRIQTPMLHTTFVLCDEMVIWIDIKEAMSYTRGRMWGLLHTYLEKEDIEQIEKNWREK